MTAQMSDRIEVDGVGHVIAGISGSGLFDPGDHGVVPRPISTACWRGYVCHYAVAGDRLRLAELRLGLGSQLGEAPIEPGTELLGSTVEAGGGEHVVRWDAFDVPFTGTLLAAHGFVQSTYVHMGYAPAWKYEHVLELTVDGGVVTGRRDLSEEMARRRESVETGAAGDPDGDRGDVRGWIARTFRLGLDRSVPRPPPER